jgi:hypothetical protein
MIWNDSSIWLRLLISGLFLAGAIRGFLKSRGLKPLAGNNRSPWVMIVLCALFAPLAAVDAVEIGKAYLYPRPVLALSFPFRGGVFVAARGGNGESPVMNYHFTGPERGNPGNGATAKFAMDIQELSAFGWSGIPFSAKMTDYPIFNAPIYSPCDGLVLYARDSQEDYSERGTGNYMVIKCTQGNLTFVVLMAHLRHGGNLVHQWDSVGAGQIIAHAGNAGQAGRTYPHLHMQANLYDAAAPWGGVGASVPVVFDGRFLVKNSLIFR